MLNWAVMFGAIGAQRGRADRLHPDLAPRPVHDAVPAASARASTPPTQVARAVRRLQVPEPGLPVLQASAGRGLRPEQAAVRVAPQRRRCATASSNDFEKVADEYELRGQQRKAAEEMINVGKGGLVSEHVGPLAEAGAHPLQALMSLHVIFSTTHKRGQQAMARAGEALTGLRTC